MFSSERVFTIRMANGETYKGLAPRFFCWNAQGNLISEDEPTQEVDGKIAARIIDELDAGQFAVEVPDGEVIAVTKDQILPRPTVIRPPGTFAPSEPPPHVPV
jgi:hypothetical protein